MDPFTAIMGLAGLFTTLMTVTKGISDSQKANETSKTTTDLAKENLQFQKDSASQNLAMQKEQFEYQKQLNNLQMEREDTAFQRQVKDLQSAGLSPLMVAGNGAAATPLTSATAPQLDTSGINQAIQNAVGAYNDSFNRHIQARQFSLQSKVQAAQAFTQLAEFKVQKKKADLENQYLNEKLNWEKTHGFRDLDWKSELLNFAETIVNKYKDNNVIPDINNLFPSTGDVSNSLDLYDYMKNKMQPEYRNVTNNYNYSKDKNTKSDQKKLLSNVSKEWVNSSDILSSQSPSTSDKYMDSLKFIYRYTDAWRDFETMQQFYYALQNEDFRKTIKEKYPYKPPVSIR